MGNKYDLSDFNQVIDVGIWRAGRVFQNLMIWEFHTQAALEFTQNVAKKKKRHTDN